jgi:hypothetical protein
MKPRTGLQQIRRRISERVQRHARQHVFIYRKLEMQRLFDPKRIRGQFCTGALHVGTIDQPHQRAHQANKSDDGQKWNERQQINPTVRMCAVDHPGVSARTERAVLSFRSLQCSALPDSAPWFIRLGLPVGVYCGNPQ